MLSDEQIKETVILPLFYEWANRNSANVDNIGILMVAIFRDAYAKGVRDAAEKATAERDFAIGLERAKGERDEVLHARGSTAAVILADILSLLDGKGA